MPNATSAPPARRDWRLLAAILIVVTVAALPVLTYPLGRDQGEFATIGRGILQGKAPYVDLWNPKPPAVFYVYALAIRLFGPSVAALRLLDLLIIPPVAAALFWLGSRFTSARIGLWAALLFPVFYFTETFWTLTQNDGIVLLPMTLALVATVKAADGERRAPFWSFLAGTLAALTLWFKYPFVLFVLFLIAAYFLVKNRVRHASPRPLNRVVILAFVAGGLLVGVGGIIYLASISALEALIESALVTSGYTALGFNTADLVESLRTAITFRWAHWGLLFVLALLWPLLHLRRSSTDGRAWRVGWRIVWLWLAAGAAIMLIQAKGYDYHWLPMLPPLALLAASTVENAIERLRSLFSRYSLPAPLVGEGPGVRGQNRLITALTTLIAFALLAVLIAGIWPKALPYLTGQETLVEYGRRFQAGEFIAAESIEVADHLKARVAPGDSLYIWGFRPEIYYLSGLNPATRFIFQFPLVADWYPADWQEENVDVLWAAMPPYALVLQADYMPWVTGSDDDSNTLLQRYTELNNWLIANYERETQIGNVFLWRRNP